MAVRVPERPPAGTVSELEEWMDRRVVQTGVKGGLVGRRQRSRLGRGIGTQAAVAWGGGSRATNMTGTTPYEIRSLWLEVALFCDLMVTEYTGWPCEVTCHRGRTELSGEAA